MTVLLESPWYQEIFELGEAKGRARGEIIAEAKLELKPLLSSIELGLEMKFGAAGLKIFPEISQITDINKLKQIKEVVKTAKNLAQIKRTYRKKK